MPAMPNRCLLLPALLLAGAACAQTAPSATELDNLREDVRGLTQQVNNLSLQVEQLEQQNQQLQNRAEASQGAYATVVQLNSAVAALNQTIQTAVAGSQSEVLAQVGADMQKLVRQVNAALRTASRAETPAAPATFSSDFPQTGISYTVQRGDTLALIAKKNGARLKDIINANKIADPSLIRVGQTLFIPGGK
jgi:LysM repeat protein